MTTEPTRHDRIRTLFQQATEMEETQLRWFLQSIQDRDLAADVERLLNSSACCGSFRDDCAGTKDESEK